MPTSDSHGSQLAADPKQTVHLTWSGEECPWKQLFLNILPDKAQKAIGDGITKVAYRRQSEKDWYEITCRDGSKWLVMQRFGVEKRIADDNKAYSWSEFDDYYRQRAWNKWQNSEPEKNRVCFMRTGQRELLQINSVKPPQHNNKKKDK